MRIEWTAAKNEGNRAKHGIDFETATLVFADPFHVAFVERVSGGEERWHAIGSIDGILVVVVAHTYGVEGAEEIIRIISARRATRREREVYGEAIG